MTGFPAPTTPRTLSVAVREKPTVRTDRPHGTDAVRYMSVPAGEFAARRADSHGHRP